MTDIEDLFPPAQYAPVWLLIAAGIIALGLLLTLVVLWLTRPKYSLERRGSASISAPDQGAMTAALRGEYLARLDAVGEAYARGELGAREANLMLSREVRGFVQEYSGYEAPVLGLHDLIAAGVPQPLVDAMGRHYYPSIFRPAMAIDPVAGVAAGKLVVTSWH